MGGCFSFILVAPEHIELTAILHKRVCTCQALKYDDGMRLHVVRNVSALSAADLLGFLSERLPKYMMPNRVEFVEAVERARSGKIRRHSAKQVKPAEQELL